MERSLVLYFLCRTTVEVLYCCITIYLISLDLLDTLEQIMERSLVLYCLCTTTVEELHCCITTYLISLDLLDTLEQIMGRSRVLYSLITAVEVLYIILPDLLRSAGHARTDNGKEPCTVGVLDYKPDTDNPAGCHHLTQIFK